MSDLSEMHISLRGEVQGRRPLDANVVNPLLRQYRGLLESFKIEETKSNGKLLKIWTQFVDEFNSELLVDKKGLLFSHKLKINVFDEHPHSFNNYQHSIQVKIAEGLGKIRIDNLKPYSQKIFVETTGIKFAGEARTAGRWPEEKILGIGI